MKPIGAFIPRPPLVKLPGPRIINLSRVNEIEFEPDPAIAKITWASGDAPLILLGNQAIALMDAIDSLAPLDVSYIVEGGDE